MLPPGELNAEDRRDRTRPAVGAVDPRRLRDDFTAGLTAFPRAAVGERWRLVVQQWRFVPVPGTLAQSIMLRSGQGSLCDSRGESDPVA